MIVTWDVVFQAVTNEDLPDDVRADFCELLTGEHHNKFSWNYLVNANLQNFHTCISWFSQTPSEATIQITIIGNLWANRGFFFHTYFDLKSDLFLDIGENTSILDTTGNVFVYDKVKKYDSMDDWLNTQFFYVSRKRPISKFSSLCLHGSLC